MTELELRALREADDRSDFRCGQPDLDRYFHHYAGQNQFRLHLSVTLVAVLQRRIVGYATVSGASIERASLPRAATRKQYPAYPLPVLRLARLAVDERARNLGVGSALLRRVLKTALAQRKVAGCVGVVTDAKADAVDFYRRYGFSPLGEVREGLLVSEPQAMFLPLAMVAG